MERLKRAVIKEEFIAITGGFEKALILNQFLYWSERVSDFDEFIKQENERAVQQGEEPREITNGWIYKRAEDLSSETMLNLSKQRMRAYITELVEEGFIDERENPKYKWDRTKQYRVNLVNIVNALQEKGYTLEGYKVELASSKMELGYSKMELHSNQNGTAIPETTTETTLETTLEKKKIKEQNLKDEFQILWKMYPNKKDKAKSLGYYIKARKNGTTFEEVKKGIENYKEYIKIRGLPSIYIKHGKTWFGNECWTDEYDLTPTSQPKQEPKNQELKGLAKYQL